MPLGSSSRLQGVSKLLVEAQLLNEEEALNHQNAAINNKSSLIHYLVDNNLLDTTSIAVSIATSFGLPLLDLDAFDRHIIPINLVSEKLISRHHLLPIFHRGNSLFIATDDPSKQAGLKELQFHTGLQTCPIIVEHDKLKKTIEEILQAKDSVNLSEYLDDTSDLDNLEISAEEEDDSQGQAIDSDDAPVVKFVNKILIDAIKQGASDIHFEPYEQEYRIRYRLDGLLTLIASPPLNISTRITARIKVMSNLDISERRVPQDGRFKMKLSRNKAIDFRISTCPTVGGEKVVMRILDPSNTKLGVEGLGFNLEQEQLFLKAIDKPQGMILVTGPTGSGKSVTLYTALNIINTHEVNISTAEDPVEIKVAGINQVNINPKAGLNFANSLRSFLRQDPDIIMVGEIRDLETAEIAIKAAQTGHLVLSTLHTNSAAETLTRLANMGVPGFNIASSVSLIIAQRLARRLCESCKAPREDLAPENLIELGYDEKDAYSTKIYSAMGCPQCHNGYKGRLGLFEVLPISKPIEQIIMTGGTSLDILHQAEREGMNSMYRSGLIKIKQGLTTIEEVNRVTID